MSVSVSARRDGTPATLIYELLDAHADTAELATAPTRDPRWGAHLDYLRALQRAGRAALAQMSLEERP
jgi:hypothetical protein